MAIKFNKPPPLSTKDAGESGKKVKAEKVGVAEDHIEPFVIKDFRENYLTYHLHKHQSGPRPSRPHDHVHMSDLDPARKWCPREPALLTFHNQKRNPDYLGVAQKVVFELGRRVADMVIDFLPPDRVWGNWKCLSCETIWKRRFMPACCPGCSAGRHMLSYREVMFRDPATGVTGSVDLFYDLLGSGIVTGFELKSEGNEKFLKRSKPEFEHEWRSMGYLYLLNRANKDHVKNINLKDFRVVYVSKEGHQESAKLKQWGLTGMARTPLKEYWVNRNDEMVEARFDLAFEYRQWRDAYDDGKVLPLPPRIPYCTSKGCVRAKSCKVVKECWS